MAATNTNGASTRNNFSHRFRRRFGRIASVGQLPNLIALQMDSYAGFLQRGRDEKTRKQSRRFWCFDSVFPVESFAGHALLEFVNYDFDPPKYDPLECRRSSLTYSAPMRVQLRLVVFDVDESTGAKTIKDIKEQEVYFGDMPLMTESGTFIVNGSERVVVSQMHRSPGVFFDHDKGKTQVNRLLYAARVIPYRGSWLDIEFDAKDLIHARIDRRRKIPVTSLLRAFGLDEDDIIATFYPIVDARRLKAKKGWKVGFDPERLKGLKVREDLVDADSGEVIAPAGMRLTSRKLKEIAKLGVEHLFLRDAQMEGRYLAESVVSTQTGQIFASAGDELDETLLQELGAQGFNTLRLIDADPVTGGAYIRNTLLADKNESREDVLFDIYRVMRPGEPPTIDAAETMFKSLFSNAERYDLSAVGRVKMNLRLGLDTADSVGTLQLEDIAAVIKVLIDLRDGKGEVDDIDHLGNRRVRSVGELMENHYRAGLSRMERSIKEKMGAADIDAVMPQDLINAKPVNSTVREFFGSSQLSQFMDQTNPLSEVTHKRRLSALGPGGLSRDRAGFEARDVHTTHYGRICPIETPEGPNIGLINSLASYARVNKYGFIETPFRRVTKGVATEEIVYLSAAEESSYTISQASTDLDEKNRIVEEIVTCRRNGEIVPSPRDEIDLMDLSPMQIVSVAASLIPFLENDDANRALMGSNMQRQAVPLLRAEAPLVGTGMESIVARDSGAAISAERAGIVDLVDSTRIVIHPTEETDPSKPGVDIYSLMKFQRSNQSTCINQRPLVKAGDTIRAGQIIADGPATDQGEIALGRNVLVAFMPWMGYNFKDSIMLSERMVTDDVFTSIHIEEFECAARDTKLGPDQITRDIPNVAEEALRNLDESGIIHIGAEVGAGDILVGKITPKGESPMTPEEKLLRAIFGEKASDVRDTSLRVPPGASGTVVEVRVFNRHGIEKDERALAIERAELERQALDRDDERSIVDRNSYRRLRNFLIGKSVAKGEGPIKKGSQLDDALLDEVPRSSWWKLALKEPDAQNEFEAMHDNYKQSLKNIEARFADKVEKIRRGDDLPPATMKTVRVFIAVKRKIQPGDKMAGRHGNKGVVSKIMPVEDMPFLEDGTPIDVVLSPLGVPSRMNVGQILETHMGWACRGVGRKIAAMVNSYYADKNAAPLREELQRYYVNHNREVPERDEELLEEAIALKSGLPIATPVFDGARLDDIETMMKNAGLGDTGQVTLYDGRTGEPFDRPVTTGYIYILKLHHLVDEKIHARSIGPYSLVTQQPLGGKSHFGGQRFGEMEVWALEAYGAAYSLQEMLTVKSDDVAGRTKVYEAIVRGDSDFEAGIPEGFNVLVKEIQALGLDISLSSEPADEDADALSRVPIEGNLADGEDGGDLIG